MIGVVVKGITLLKILQPIMDELCDAGQPYILYHTNKSPTPYNDPTIVNMNRSSKTITKNAIKTVSFKNNKELVELMRADGITKLVGVELYSSLKNEINGIKKCNIRLYSICWLIDNFWEKDRRAITSLDRIYYTTKYTKETIHKFLNIKENKDRDRLLGSPLIPYPAEKQSDGEKLLILIPNMKEYHYQRGFVAEEYFNQSIAALSKNHNLLYKTRPKQWIPPSIKKYTKNDIISDKYKMVPPPTWDVFKQSHSTMLYYSSGVFETVCAGNYVLSVPISLKRYKKLGWPGDRLKYHFSNRKDHIYNFKGVVESVRLCNIFNGKWKLNKRIDLEARQCYIEQFVGPVFMNPAKEIVADIIGHSTLF